MTLSRVEHALGMMRIYLVECAAQNEWGDHRADELAQTIAACIRQTTDEGGQKAPQRDPRLPRDVLRRAIRFVNDNLDSKLKWDEIAMAVGLDPFTFGRGFKLSTGMTPHQYIIRCRLRRAMRLLAREELTLADIALEVGCSCQSHLTTLFRKHLGTTPGAFRMSAREGQQRVPHFTRPTAGYTRNQGAMGEQRSGFAVARIQAQ
jgi:transcriptional regulator GlxA family with amidase domain